MGKATNSRRPAQKTPDSGAIRGKAAKAKGKAAVQLGAKPAPKAVSQRAGKPVSTHAAKRPLQQAAKQEPKPTKVAAKPAARPNQSVVARPLAATTVVKAPLEPDPKSLATVRVQHPTASREGSPSSDGGGSDAERVPPPLPVPIASFTF